MTQMFPCDPVGLELLEDAEAWPQWSYVTHMTWTSPRPFGIGTTRAIETRRHR